MDGMKFSMGVLAENRVGEVYEVWCNNCRDSVGTMTCVQVRDAIWATIGRGGILCPSCRKKTCDSCGRYFADKHAVGQIKGPTGRVRVCATCRDELVLIAGSSPATARQAQGGAEGGQAESLSFSPYLKAEKK